MDKEYIHISPIENDIIDISKKPQLTLKVLKSSIKTEYKVELEGKSIDSSIVNALRRTVMLYIPVYAFHRSNIYINLERTKTMYNNDMIYNQIETLPIFDIPNYFDLENPEIYLSNDIMKNIFGNFLQEKYVDEMEGGDEIIDEKKKLFKIDISVNLKNNTDDFKFLNTHDIILKVNGKVSNSYLVREPICILVLKPDEEISLRAEANLGISKMHASYEATTNAILEEITSMKYHLWYETLEQISAEMIFDKACIIISKKLNNLHDFISKEYKERDINEQIEITLHGEEHTIGNLLSTILQKCEYVDKAGYAVPHLFIDKIMVKYKLDKKSPHKPIKVLLDCIKYLVKVFDIIRSQHLKK